MPALKLLASVILASIFCATFVVLYTTYRSESAEAKFKREADQLAELIMALADQDPGSTMLFTIDVPSNCQLRFEDNFVVTLIEDEIERRDTSTALTGPSFSGRRVELTLRRTSEGVEVSG